MYIKELDLDIPSFTQDDVNMSLVHKTAAVEAKAIFDSGTRTGGRSYEQIYDHTIQGHIAEHYLKQVLAFEDDSRSYMDVVYNGLKIDVKTSTNMTRNLTSVLSEMNIRNTWTPVKYDYILAFNIDALKTYHCVGIYKVKKPGEQTSYKFIKVYEAKNGLKIRSTPESLFNAMLDKKGKEAAIKILKDYGYSVSVIT